MRSRRRGARSWASILLPILAAAAAAGTSEATRHHKEELRKATKANQQPSAHLLTSDSFDLVNDIHSVTSEPTKYVVAEVPLICPAGWSLLGATCWRAFRSVHSFDRAEAECARYGAHLGRVDEERENVQALNLTSAASSGARAFWIGLRASPSPASPHSIDDTLFSWSDGSVASQFAGFWSPPDQPDLDVGLCTSIDTATGLWKMDACARLLPFVCSRRACLADEFCCDSGGCAPSGARCDGRAQCADRSDELNCPAAHADAACEQSFRNGETAGAFTTPAHPASYKPNADCLWVIEVEERQRIQLIFESFETETASDVVTILDGGPAENTSFVLATLSGTPSVAELTLTSASNWLAVRFRSDGLVQARGFAAKWRAVSPTCGGRLTASSSEQSFSASPAYPGAYSRGSECAWRIDAPSGEVLSITIDDLQLGKSARLRIWDGPSPTPEFKSPALLDLQGEIERVPPGKWIISTQSSLYISLETSPEEVPKRGFSISYKKGCSLTVRAVHGEISSPGAGKVAYPNYKRCEWSVEIPQGGSAPRSMSLNFEHFDLAEASGNGDRVLVFDGGDESRPLHGSLGFSAHSPPPSSLHSSRKVSVVFETDALHQSSGWKARFSADCPALETPSALVSLSSSATAFGSKVRVSCARGYEFVDGRGRNFEIVCLEGGHWRQPSDGVKNQTDPETSSDGRLSIPLCQPVYCAPAPQIPNGFAESATNTTFGGQVKYRCYSGFSMVGTASGSDMSHCTEEGRWTTPPQCRAAACPALEPLANARRSILFGDGTGFGTVLRVDCDEGYRRVGAATLLCRADGRWSPPEFSPSRCERVECPDRPDIRNGRLTLLPGGGRLLFGDAARVDCLPGYRLASGVNSSVVCGSDGKLSAAPVCEDVDECQEPGEHGCGPNAECRNREGGVDCICSPGFEPLLGCPAATLALKPSGARFSSNPRDLAQLQLEGWCAAPEDSRRTLSLIFDVAQVIERLLVERVAIGAAMQTGPPTTISIRYSNESNRPLNDYPIKGIPIDWSSGSSDVLLTLPRAVEARRLEISIDNYNGVTPCMRVTALGCARTSCIDTDECAQPDKGGCQHECVNLAGGYECACRDGFELLTEKMVADGRAPPMPIDETGYEVGAVMRFDHSCVARKCLAPQVPVHGRMAPPSGTSSSSSSQGQATYFDFATTIRFTCDFGYQMAGPSYLRCQADGRWNGTTPTCIAATCASVANSSQIGLVVDSNFGDRIPFGESVQIACSRQDRPAPKGSLLSATRECLYDPLPEGNQAGEDYWLAGPAIDCPLVDCGAPPSLSGVAYDTKTLESPDATKVGAQITFNCRPPYHLSGVSSFGDAQVRCLSDGTWDLGSLRCEGPTCVDPGRPADGRIELTSLDEGATATFTCLRPGFRPFPSSALQCKLGTACRLAEDVGISSGFVPDTAFHDNSDASNEGYEPSKARLTSSGWCGSKDAFIFLSVDLQRVYTLTTLRLSGVAGSGHLKGHVTRLQLFHKVVYASNYDTYPVEFETPAGNPNALHHFVLDPPLRARYVLLGVSEYEGEPCLRFDLQGCLAPVAAHQETPVHLQVGWNASVPECVDAEPPEFIDCPDEDLLVDVDQNGQLKMVAFTEPKAVDNSGGVAWVRVEPSDWKMPKLVTQDMDVLYTAFDNAGNTADCRVRIRIPDTQPPVMKCPESWSIGAGVDVTSQRVVFNATTVPVVLSDVSNITSLTFSPSSAELTLGSHVDVEATATDSRGNSNKCRFQVALQEERCSPWSLHTPSAGVEKKCARQPNGLMVCQIACAPGFRFLDAAQVQTRYVCSSNGVWSPAQHAPGCLAIPDEPARFELAVQLDYAVEGGSQGPVPEHCLAAYTERTAKVLDTLDTALSRRCSNSIEVFVRFLNARFRQSDERSGEVTANYTIQILPTVLQPQFYELCALTLKTIFDLRVPGATLPVKELLTVVGAEVATSIGGCPSLRAARAALSQGFGCADGETLRMPSLGIGGGSNGLSATNAGLPECLACPMGSFLRDAQCVRCPIGSYQDEPGQTTCKSCPARTSTLGEGAHSPRACLGVCSLGMWSDTGLVPCQLCARHHYSGPASSSPGSVGYRRCDACPAGTYTAGLGATGPSSCELPCEPGTYSATGLKPCSPCPPNFYQPDAGRQSCIECTNTTATALEGATSSAACRPVDCAQKLCRKGQGECAIESHRALCRCLPGWTGDLCDRPANVCATAPCTNGATCQPTASGGFQCLCPPNFSGSRCQFEADECSSAPPCPNGGVCVDLPGRGTTQCICRAGFTGPKCDEITNACEPKSPCANGGECLSLPLGRFKCRCLPGWSGPACEQNIDECAERPCALGATCTDLVADFRCDCPTGFTGKRCQEKVDLCASASCQNGVCIDELFKAKCLCASGWTGERCEINVDECQTNPCKNGATCKDMVNGFVCQCAPGFKGSLCQLQIDHCAATQGNKCAVEKGARCENSGAGAVCVCAPSYTGPRCDEPIDACALLRPCSLVGAERCVPDQETTNDDGWKCVCRKGWRGERCDQRLHPCATLTCKNGGRCVSDSNAIIGSDSAHCECAPGWRGENCGIEAGVCAQREPCKNGGTCVEIDGNGDESDYFCVCPDGVSGRDCERTPDRCVGEPCHNGGVCGDFGSRVECACPKGVHGTGCQFQSPRGCTSTSCQNGGTCRQPIGSGQETLPKCECPVGWTGASCETNVNECAAENSIASGVTVTSPQCPLLADCVDQLAGFHCKCSSANHTGANCDKPVDADFDVRVFESRVGKTARARLAVPVKMLVAAEELTIGLWVRFEKMSTENGVAATLYHSATENYTVASDARQLFQLSAEGIRISLFEDEPAVALRFPTGQSISDGSWHHVAWVWSSGSHSLLWNGVRLAHHTGYGENRTFQANLMPVVGTPFTNDHAPYHHGGAFVGSVSRWTLWKRRLDFERELPLLATDCAAAEDLLDSASVLRWTGYELFEGKVDIVTRSRCGRVATSGIESGGGSSGVTSIEAMVADLIEAPSIWIESCPSDLYVVTATREANVSWPLPTFGSRNGPVARVESSLAASSAQPLLLTWGDYDVRVAARTAPSASSEALQTSVRQSSTLCHFRVRVQRDFCPDLSEPRNGFQVCQPWGPDGRFRACRIGCHAGHAFAEKPPRFYSCGVDGRWRPTRKSGLIVGDETDDAVSPTPRYPSCGRVTEAVRRATLSASFPNIVACTAAGRTALRQHLLERLVAIDEKWHVCAQRDTAGCAGVELRVECGDSAQESNRLRHHHHRVFQLLRRAKRSPADPLRVELDVPIRSDAVVLHPETNQEIGTLDALEQEARARGLFELSEVLPGGRPSPLSLRVAERLACEKGFVVVDGGCVACQPGTFHDGRSACIPCPRATYQSNEAASACIPCEQGETTRQDGAETLDECHPSCAPGHYFSLPSGQCEPCGLGFYQPKAGQFGCRSCSPGKTTLSATADSEADCRDECADGQQLSAGGTCTPCPQGTYRARGVQRRCVDCPEGTTTEGAGAAKRTQCNTPRCLAGQFLVVASKQCQYCPRATFQDQPLQTACKLCPPDHTTAAQGATAESQCYSTNQCATGADDCSWHAVCVDLPDENDVPSYECRCRPGFRGNGTVCVDACRGYCLNDGVCKKNAVGYVECECKEQFSGQRCEVRFEVRSQRVALLTAGIGAIVLVLVLIVVIVFFTLTRFRRGAGASSLPDKPMSASAAAAAAAAAGAFSNSAIFDDLHHPHLGGGGGGMGGNFFYAPRASHPHLAIDGPPPPSHGSRPLGYYYEDDEDQDGGGNNAIDRDEPRTGILIDDGSGGGGGMAGADVYESSRSMYLHNDDDAPVGLLSSSQQQRRRRLAAAATAAHAYQRPNANGPGGPISNM